MICQGEQIGIVTIKEIAPQKIMGTIEFSHQEGYPWSIPTMYVW
jgi:hypothetical protein